MKYKIPSLDVQNVLVISKKELRDACRSKWFVLLSVIFSLISLGLSIFGLAGTGSLGISGFGRTSASLLNLTMLIVPLLGLLLGSTSIAIERDYGTLTTLLSQPITAVELLAGKLSGSFLALVSTLFIGFGLSGMVISSSAGLSYLNGYLGLLLYTVLLGAIFLSIGFLISILVKKNITAIAISLFVWFLFILFSDLGMMASSIILKLTAKQLFWLILLNPVQIFKMTVVGLLQTDMQILGSIGNYALDLFGNWYLIFLTFALLTWIFITLVLSILIFRKRPLL